MVYNVQKVTGLMPANQELQFFKGIAWARVCRPVDLNLDDFGVCRLGTLASCDMGHTMKQKSCKIHLFLSVLFLSVKIHF